VRELSTAGSKEFTACQGFSWRQLTSDAFRIHLKSQTSGDSCPTSRALGDQPTAGTERRAKIVQGWPKLRDLAQRFD
jgi:hypothetical protein